MNSETILPTGRKMRRSLFVAGIVLSILAASGGVAGAGVRYDERHSTRVLNGVSIGGVDISGKDFTESRFLLQEKFDVPLERTIKVYAGGEVFETTAKKLGTRSNAIDQLDQVVSLQTSMSIWRRLWLRLFRFSLGNQANVAVTVDESKVKDFVDKVGEKVDRSPQDAKIELIDGALRIGPDVSGFLLDRKAAERDLKKAVLRGALDVRLNGEVNDAAFKRSQITNVLVVKVGENKLYHYSGENLSKVYDIATGLPRYPTPKGLFKVINKRKNPTWVNPAKYPGGWGWNLPARIGPGPRNPLGTRALDLNTPGIRIHGTSAQYSIGYNASHGCIRMRIADVEELFDLIPAGTPVLIIQSGLNRTIPSRPAPPEVEPTAENDATVPEPAPSPSSSSPAIPPKP